MSIARKNERSVSTIGYTPYLKFYISSDDSVYVDISARGNST